MSDVENRADDDATTASPSQPPKGQLSVETLKDILERPQDNTPTQLIATLKKAQDLHVDRALLAKTKLGLVVSKLKKHENAEVAALSRELVTKWRAAVSSTNASSTPKGEQDGKEDGDASRSKKRAHDEAFADSMNEVVSVDSKYTGPFTREEKRNKCREFIFRAFLEGMGDEQRNMLNVDNVCRLVGAIEDALHEYHCEKNNDAKEYNTQLRAIKSNLADKKNPEFNARIYLGAITAEALASMPSTEMASDAKKRERQKAKKDALEACQSDWDLRNVKRAKGQFPCGKCKSENTTYFQMQTRSSDEPMTTYVNCLNCGNRWKF